MTMYLIVESTGLKDSTVGGFLCRTKANQEAAKLAKFHLGEAVQSRLSLDGTRHFYTKGPAPAPEKVWSVSVEAREEGLFGN